MIYLFVAFIGAGLMKIYSILTERINEVNADGFSLNILRWGAFSLSFLTLLIPAAVRYGIGIDYITYSNWQIPNILEDTKFGQDLEIGYRFLVRVGYWMSGDTNYQLIFALTAFVILVFTYKAIHDQSLMPAFSVLLVVFSSFYNYSFSGMRQSIAIAIWLYSVKYIKNNSFWRYCACIAIAFLFHRTALIYLPLFFLNKITIKFSFAISALGVVYIGSSFIRTEIISIINQTGYYSSYFGGKYDNGDYSRNTLVLITITTIIVTISRYFSSKEDREVTKVQTNIQYGLFILQGLVSVLPTPNRLLYLFIPLIFILVPNAISSITVKRYRTVIVVAAFFFYLAYAVYVIFKVKTYGTYPYVSIWG